MEEVIPVVPTEGTIVAEEVQTDVVDEVTLPSDEVTFDMPEKFAGKTAEEIARSYMELEAMKNEPKEETSEELIEEHAGDTKDLIDEYTNRGTEITEEDYAVLKEKGYSKEQVDTYKAGVEAQQATKAVELMTTAGTTPDEAKQAGEWARENWSEDRVSQFNTAISTANTDVQVQMLQMLTETYRNDSSKPQAVDPIHAQSRGLSKSTAYESMEQLMVDIGDPRYDRHGNGTRDMAFYNAVKAKVAKSNL